ncbi:MAG: acyltransferase [Bacteroidaceae bacterium]
MDKTRVKKFCISYPWIGKVYSLVMRNRCINKGKRNHINLANAFMKQCCICIYGNDNTILFEKGFSRLKKCNINLFGNNNIIHIGGGVNLHGCIFHVEDDKNIISIGDYTTVSGQTQLAAIEGTKIEVGSHCLFSANITFRTGDSHSITDSVTNKRINPSRSIKIEDHVWIGNTVIVLKGSNIAKDSIISTGAIVTGKIFPSNSIIGGVPAMVLKSGVNWTAEKIKE